MYCLQSFRKQNYTKSEDKKFGTRWLKSSNIYTNTVIIFLFFPADIVFIVKDKQHPRFRREGINLIHTAKVPLGKALTGTTVEIFTLDERIIHIPINDIIK